MTWFRRVAYFLILNIVVAITISAVLNILGLQTYLQVRGFSLGPMFAFYLIWGMGGAFISLLMSKVAAKFMMGVRILDPASSQGEERNLIETVHRLATEARLPKMPEVGIYDSPEVNAFATGPSKSNSLVAVSTGLLARMDRRSLEGVLGHEISHVANGDMVTMTLLQGVVNAFVYILARLAALAIDSALRDRNDRGEGLGYMGRWLVTMVLEMLLFIPGSMIIAMYSRRREFRADEGGARLAGRDKMIAALRTLQSLSPLNDEVSKQQKPAPAIAALKISGAGGGRMALLFASHPPLPERIAHLQSFYGDGPISGSSSGAGGSSSGSGFDGGFGTRR